MAVAAIQDASPEATHWEPRDYLQQNFLVAAENQTVIGFLVSRAVSHDEYEILNLAVTPAHRRRGVAKGLLLAWLNSISGTVFLEVRESNVAAQSFYKRLGFQAVSVRKNYYLDPSEAAIVMKFHSC